MIDRRAAGYLLALAAIVAAALPVGGALPHAEAGACAPPWLHPVVLTSRVPAGRGVLVGLSANSGRPSLFAITTRTPFDSLALSAVDETPEVPPPSFLREELAPGLVRFVPSRALAGTVSIDTEATDEPIRLSAVRSTRVLAAPRVRRIRRSSFGYHEVVLGSAIPRGAIAAIVYGYEASGPSHPLAWIELPSTRGRAVALPGPGGRCDPSPPGFLPIVGRAPDPRIELAWVGQGGDVSPRSEPVTPDPPESDGVSDLGELLR